MTEDSSLTLERPPVVIIRGARKTDLPELNEMITLLPPTMAMRRRSRRLSLSATCSAPCPGCMVSSPKPMVL